MSYVPTLLIKVEDLEKHREALEKVRWGITPDEETRGGTENKTVMEIIAEAWDNDPACFIDVFGIKCAQITPGLTNFNEKVREKLTELNVSFVAID